MRKKKGSPNKAEKERNPHLLPGSGRTHAGEQWRRAASLALFDWFSGLAARLQRGKEEDGGRREQSRRRAASGLAVL
jgi:hypothetical protein